MHIYPATIIHLSPPTQPLPLAPPHTPYTQYTLYLYIHSRPSSTCPLYIHTNLPSSLHKTCFSLWPSLSCFSFPFSPLSPIEMCNKWIYIITLCLLPTPTPSPPNPPSVLPNSFLFLMLIAFYACMPSLFFSLSSLHRSFSLVLALSSLPSPLMELNC